MIVLQTKQVRITLLILVGLCALSAGYFSAQLAGFLLQPPAETTTAGVTGPIDRNTTPATVDTALILRKNIFNPEARGGTGEIPRPQSAAPVTTAASGSLKLFGTVDGGANPLALIETGGKVNIYRIGDDIPGGGELLSVTRNEAIIRQPDGTEAKLVIVKPAVSSSAPPKAATGRSGIRDLGENRWSVARTEVDKARSNLNQLLKSARMEPNIVNGQTEGFTVKMVRPKSLLAQLGIRRGDTVTRVNGVELNSPEKALQIFQQLREAKRLTVDLKRGNENLTYDYEVN